MNPSFKKKERIHFILNFMTKIIISTIYFFSFTFCCIAQTDKFWVVGRNCNLDFRTGICKPDSTNNTNQLILPQTSTNICDNNGNLIFYSDGYQVMNKNYQLMPNGNNFNHGTHANSYIISGTGYPIIKCAVIIPFVNDTNKYYMFYENSEYTDNGSGLPDRLQYLIVDKTLDGGLGDVTAKDQVIVQGDSLYGGSVFAIKHGNGKDWWIIARKFHSNQFYMVLVDSAGPHTPIIQHLGSPYMFTSVYHCVCNPSIDGSKLAYLYFSFGANPITQLDIYDFDRCAGNLSNYKKLDLFTTAVGDTMYSNAVCLSPNNRFAYVHNGGGMWQLDLQKSNPYMSRIRVGVWDGTSAPSNTLFWQMKNGPDGKIYVSTYGSTQYIHVINNPDVLDTFCNFKQKQILFGTLGYYGHTNGEAHFSDGCLPNIPNFALGAIAPCGNVGVAEVKEEGQSRTFGIVYPNPASQSIVVSSKSLVNTIEVRDVLGRVVIQQIKNSSTQQIQIDVSSLSSGLYFIKATDIKGNTMNGKFVKE
ncbi:MAG: hypothetical protein RJA07_2170 [Bacteroidota bacterium]|jgi:hypothetical protein